MKKMLEDAINTSVVNPRHCLYFKDSKRECAITLVNAHRIYRLRGIKEHYQKSLDVHEGAHIRACLNTSFKKFLITYSLLSPSGYKPIQKDLLIIYNYEIVPFLEAFALYLQTNHSVTPKDLKEGIINELSTRDPTTFQIMSDLDIVLEKLKSKCRKKPIRSPFDIFSIVMNIIFSSINPIEDRIFDRYRLIEKLSEKEIPKWSKTNELTTFLTDFFEGNNHEVAFRGFYTAESLVLVYDFWHYIKQLIEEKKVAWTLIKRYIFAILSELDDEFAPIIYETDDLRKLENPRISQCLICRRISQKKFFKSTGDARFSFLDEIVVRLKNKKIKDSLKELRNDYTRLNKLKTKVFSKCPGNDVCIGKERCQLEDDLFNNLKEFF
jgi:hypothetical protein